MAARLVGRVWLALLIGAIAVAANVEKVIFVAGQGAADGASALRSSILSSILPRLTPDGNAWRTGLPAVFSWEDHFPDNGTTWVLLDDLSEGQRYELRVCWAATQPTAFTVEVFDLATVATTAELLASLDSFLGRLGTQPKPPGASSSAPSTTSLLRIVAAADFVAADRSAMRPGSVPPVLTDIILDPYLFNVLPRSLVPIVAAILAVAGVSAWLARRVILPGLQAVAADGRGDDLSRI
ncbi:MAG: hypothetical protein STHCBS139747_000489 [Sporothrix thermara]